MTILCGTDFSEPARAAASVAAGLAALRGAKLLLLHALDLPWVPIASTEVPIAIDAAWTSAREAAREAASQRLAQEAERLGALGAQVETLLREGLADEALARAAAERRAELVVVASVGRRSASRWRLGSVADRVAQSAPAPVLVVRDAAPFEAWTRGERALRVALALDFDASAEPAQTFVARLRHDAACDVVRIHVYRREAELERAGLSPQSDDERAVARIERELAADLDARFGATLAGRGALATRVVPARASDEADDVVRTAAEERADLVVVGSHQRSGWSRLWHGSVSYRVLPLAAVSVACVPAAPAAERTAGVGLRRIVAATDFSEVGDRAVAHAFELVSAGGTVTLLHVLDAPPPPNPLYAHYADTQDASPEQRARRRREAEQRLRALVPRSAREAGVEARVEVVDSDDVAGAACEEARRAGADALCVGTHGRTALGDAVLGSVAQAVLRACERPVVLVGPRAKG